MKLFRSTALLVLICAALCAASSAGFADELPWSQRVANAAIARWPGGRVAPADATWRRNYQLGTMLKGVDTVWMGTADPKYFHYIQDSVDGLLGPEGLIPTDGTDEHRPQAILLGRQLLLLYGVTQKPKYLKAATALDEQPEPQRDAGKMWRDGVDRAEPFYAGYAALSHHPEKFNDITQQFALMEEQPPPELSARAMGGYMMALVDALGYYPQNDPGRAQLLAILGREAAMAARDQDPASGLWPRVVNKRNAKGSDLEPSTACMFVYALVKGVRRGYLPMRYLGNAERAYRGVLSHFFKTDSNGEVLLGDRDGSGSESAGEGRLSSDPGSVGAFLLASVEMENAPNVKLGRGDTVVVDGWFNSQQRTDAFGKTDYFHYKWKTEDEPGYSMFGHLFRLFGAHTAELDAEPTFANLKDAQVYVIVSPDNLDKNPKAHFANAEDADQIARWVRAGGVLVIMENDTSFADLEHFNVISEKFGIHFNSVLRKHVIGTQWDMGKIVVDGNGPIFHHPHSFYMKDVCTISVSGPARPALTEDGDIFMATAKYGKGTVYANVDPWLYNEYTDGRKLPVEYDNLAGGKELARWVLEQVPHAQ